MWSGGWPRGNEARRLQRYAPGDTWPVHGDQLGWTCQVRTQTLAQRDPQPPSKGAAVGQEHRQGRRGPTLSLSGF